VRGVPAVLRDRQRARRDLQPVHRTSEVPQRQRCAVQVLQQHLVVLRRLCCLDAEPVLVQRLLNLACTERTDSQPPVIQRGLRPARGTLPGLQRRPVERRRCPAVVFREGFARALFQIFRRFLRPQTQYQPGRDTCDRGH